MPAEIKSKFKVSKKAQELYPKDLWLVEAWEPSVKPWYTIQNRAYELGLIKECMIGDCRCMFLPVREVLELYQQALKSDPFGLYGMIK